MKFYPLKFKDSFHERIWGGFALKEKLNKNLSEGKKVGESWELSGQPDFPSIVKDGPDASQSINDLVKKYPREILGKELSRKFSYFPLLFKFIDANDKLSIQVHPDDDYAKKNENSLGKTECWYVVDAKPGAKIVCGLKEGVQKKDLAQGLKNSNLEKYLNEFEVGQGDIILVDAGTVHALMEGVLVYEVQEASDITYRLYDWGRVDESGKSRELHIDKSLDVIKYDDATKCYFRNSELKDVGGRVAECEYFSIDKIHVKSGLQRNLNDRFEVITVISGEGKIFSDDCVTEISLGETVLIPASLKNYKIDSLSDDFVVLITAIPF